MRRGFKTEANAIAREVRGELSLPPTSPLDVWQLADYLNIPVFPLSSLRSAAPLAAQIFLSEGEAMFSGVTVFRGSHRTIVFNDAHVLGRQASDVGHELSHGLLLHTPTQAMDGKGCRLWDGTAEAEADWLSAALLVPEEAALLIVRRGWSLAKAATEYGVTERMVRFRLNVTAAKKRVQRTRAKQESESTPVPLAPAKNCAQ